jgi:serine/threonine protein kinase
MAEWKSGQAILGEYTIEKELGRGGMGRVWLVKSNSTGRRFAVKQTLLTEDKHRKAFLAELQTWIDLPEHPNIVPCRFFRTVGDEIVIFADFVEGGSLADWIAKGKLTGLEQILEVAIQFAWGLHAIHERGLIHQDVKPGNVLMTPEGVPMVTDFGLARARLRAVNGTFISPALPPGQQSVLVSSGGMTPAYASPEQRKGLPLSRKTDIWSWGVSVLDMFMGGVSCPHGGYIADAVLKDFCGMECEDTHASQIPTSMRMLLESCFAAEVADRPSDLMQVSKATIHIYEEVLGHAYRQPFSVAVDKGKLLTLVRQNTAHGQWRDPSYWLAVSSRVEATTRLPEPGRSRAPASRVALAVHDLSQYLDARAKLTRLHETSGEHAKSLAELCFDLAHLYADINDENGEVEAYDACVRYTHVVLASPSPSHDDVLWGYCLRAAALRDKAIGFRQRADYDNAIAICIQSLETWRTLLKIAPKESTYLLRYCETLRNAGIILRKTRLPSEALQFYDEAIEKYLILLAEERDDSWRECVFALAQTLNLKGVAHRAIEQRNDALAAYNKATDMLMMVMKTDTDISCLAEMALLCSNKALVLPPAEAEGLCMQAADIYQALIDDYGITGFGHDLARCFLNASGVASEDGRVSDALRYIREAVGGWRRLVHDEGRSELLPDYLEARIVMVELLTMSGDASVWEEAEEIDGAFRSLGDIGTAPELSDLASRWASVRALSLGPQERGEVR